MAHKAFTTTTSSGGVLHSYLPLMSNQELDDMESLQPLETAGYYYHHPNATNNSDGGLRSSFTNVMRGLQQRTQGNNHRRTSLGEEEGDIVGITATETEVIRRRDDV